MSVETAQASIDAALKPLIGQEFGSIRVIDAEGQLDADPQGEPIVHITLNVSDPQDEEGTWPLEDVDAVQHEAQRLLAESDPDLPYAVVELFPETEEVEEDDAAEEDSELMDALDSDSAD